jgi:nicotinamidase-related amidase
MHAGSSDLHGSAPDCSQVALLLIDVINDFDFPEASDLLRHAEPMADKIAQLAARARDLRIPVIYVNDNFGRWRSDFRAQVEHCLRHGGRGAKIVKQLRPEEADYFVLKPKHSGFFSTTLETLLEYLGVRSVILTGVAANICVLFTANDAYMRDLRLIVPEDCVASNTEELTAYAIEQMRSVLKAEVAKSQDIDEKWLRELQKGIGPQWHKELGTSC